MCTLLPAEKLHNQSVRWSLRAGLRFYSRLLVEDVFFFTDMETLIINKLEDERVFSFTVVYSAPSPLLGKVYRSFFLYVFFCLFVFFLAMSSSTTQSSIY